MTDPPPYHERLAASIERERWVLEVVGSRRVHLLNWARFGLRECRHPRAYWFCVQHPSGGRKCEVCMRAHLAARRSRHGRHGSCEVCNEPAGIGFAELWQPPSNPPMTVPCWPAAVVLVGLNVCDEHRPRYHGPGDITDVWCDLQDRDGLSVSSAALSAECSVEVRDLPGSCASVSAHTEEFP